MTRVNYTIDGRRCHISVEDWGCRASIYRSESECPEEAATIERLVSMTNALFDSVECRKLFPFVVHGNIHRFDANLIYTVAGKFSIKKIPRVTALWVLEKAARYVDVLPRILYYRDTLTMRINTFSPQYWRRIKEAVSEAVAVENQSPPPGAVVIAALAEKIPLKLRHDLSRYYDSYAKHVVSAPSLRDALQHIVNEDALEIKADEIYIYGMPALRTLTVMSSGDLRFVYAIVKELLAMGVISPESLSEEVVTYMLRYTGGRAILEDWWRKLPYRLKRAASMYDALIVAAEQPEAVDKETLAVLKEVAAEVLYDQEYSLSYIPEEERLPPRLLERMFTRGQARVKDGVMTWRSFTGKPIPLGAGIGFTVSVPGGVEVDVSAEAFEDAVEYIIRNYNMMLLSARDAPE